MSYFPRKCSKHHQTIYEYLLKLHLVAGFRYFSLQSEPWMISMDGAQDPGFVSKVPTKNMARHQAPHQACGDLGNLRNFSGLLSTFPRYQILGDVCNFCHNYPNSHYIPLRESIMYPIPNVMVAPFFFDSSCVAKCLSSTK